MFCGIISSFFGVSFIILLMDLLFISNIDLAVTIGRVSVIGKDVYTFTGNVRIDLLYMWLFLFTSAILYFIQYKNSLHLVASGISLLGLVLATTGVSLSINILLAVLCFMMWFLYSIHRKLIDTIIIAVAYGLGVVESIKILYLAAKVLTGVYPWFNHPVYVNAVLWYALWPMVPISIVLIILISLSKILFEAGVLPQEARDKLDEYLAMIWRKFPGLERILTSSDREDKVFLSSWFFLGIGLSILVAVLPYIPSLNPDGTPVNTDWVYYDKWLNKMINGDFSILITRSDRPLYFLILYIFWLVARIDPRTIAVYHNIPLFGLYTFSVYLLTRRWMGRKAADIAAIITPFSPIMLSYLYAGFQANLLAISLVFIALSLVQSNSREKLAIGLALLGIVMFIHEWTWTQYMFVLAIYIVLRIVMCIRRRDTLDWSDKAIIVFLITGFAIDFTKQLLLEAFSSATVVAEVTSINVKRTYINSIYWFTTIYTGGTLDNPLFYVLALLGTDSLGLSIPGISVVASLAPILLPNTVITYRLILNTPFIPLTAYGLSRLEPKLRLLLIISLIGIGLWRLYSIIPGLPLT